MSKTKSIVFQLKFVDLLNNPFPNLYHEVRESGTPISISKSDSQGLGTPISRPPGTILVVHIRHPLTKEMIKVKSYISVPAKEGKYTLKAPFYIQLAKLKALSEISGSYKRSTHKVAAGKDEYEVKKGQDLYTIAKMHDTTWQILAQLNKSTIKDPDKIVTGQFIKVPPKGSSLTGITNERPDSLTSQTQYKVKKGETLSGISQRSGVSVGELQRMNGITNPTTLQEGQTIKLRGNGSAQSHASPKSSPTSTAKPRPTTAPSSSDEEDGLFNGVLDTVTDIAKGTVGAIGGATKWIGDKAKEGVEGVTDAMSGGKKDEPAGGAPAAGTNAKIKTDTPIKIPVEQEYSSKDGTPKVVSGTVCKDDPACIFKGRTTDEAEKKLVLEVNIRLAGFGGALPSSDFTHLTEKCIKQFQRDYMKAPETGKICGSLIKAIDKFNYQYPIGPYHEQMKCPCGQCSGFGNGRMSVPSGNNIANEYPGTHRSVIWMLKAMMFYLDSVYPELKFTLESIDSAYRCIIRNEQKGRKTVNHMGLAFDMHFNKNGVRTKSISDMEKIRKVVFIQQMNASLKRETNIIWLEPSKWNDGSNAATSWVHYDVSRYEEKYLKVSFFSKTVVGMIGDDLSTHANNKMLACGGSFIPKIHSAELKLHLSTQDVDDIVKVTATEVVSTLSDKNFSLQAAGVVDTVLNRRMTGLKKWSTIREVINERWQFSDINAPRPTAYGSVQNVPESRVTKRLRNTVMSHLRARASGTPSSVGNNLNYANPNVLKEASASTKKWVRDVEQQAKKSGYIYGAGSAIHVHGTTQELMKHRPPPFSLILE